MSHNNTEEINAATKPEIGYEIRDVDLGGALKATYVFLAFNVAMIAITVPIFWNTIFVPDNPMGLFSTENYGKPIREERPSRLPQEPYPLIQTDRTAMTDIADLRKADAEQTDKYGWVDKNKNVARMPIEEAMKKVADQGVPGGKPTQ